MGTDEEDLLVATCLPLRDDDDGPLGEATVGVAGIPFCSFLSCDCASLLVEAYSCGITRVLSALVPTGRPGVSSLCKNERFSGTRPLRRPHSRQQRML